MPKNTFALVYCDRVVVDAVGLVLSRAGNEVLWQVGSRGHVRSKGGWSCEVYGGHCCMGENVWK